MEEQRSIESSIDRQVTGKSSSPELSESSTGKEEGGHVWSTEVPNSLFTVRNPFEVELSGDWLFDGAFPVHLGEVYLNGKSLYECDGVDKVRKPVIWPDAKYPEDSLLTWYAEVGSTTTKIWANFGSVCAPIASGLINRDAAT